jgi:hypothetical protein
LRQEKLDILRKGVKITIKEARLIKVLLWLILFVLCWPLAILALLLYPFIWLILLPFRILGIAVSGVLSVFKAIIMLPARILGG